MPEGTGIQRFPYYAGRFGEVCNINLVISLVTGRK